MTIAETFIAIGASLSSAASTASATVGSMFAGGGAAASGAGAAATGASTLSNVLSVGSALASIGSGIAGYKASKDAARESNVQAAQIKAQGAQKRASLAQEFAEMSADQTAVAVASGLNPGVGTPASVRASTRRMNDQNLSVSRENTRNRFRAQRARSRSLLSQGRTSLITGLQSAGGQLADQFQTTGFGQ